MKVTFLEEPGGPDQEDRGINEAGIQTFAHDRKNSVARETSQNSNDAAKESERPVQLSYNLRFVPKENFPDHTIFSDHLTDCIEYNRTLGRDDAVETLEEAIRILELSKIPVLLISDSHTTGAEGPCKVGKPFHTLVVSEGVSSKPDEFSGGSFGIGKNAAFSATALRTVFYSTVCGNADETISSYAMGKTILTNFEDRSGIYRKHKGVWGDGTSVITDQAAIPDWLRRDQKGLTIGIPGFEASENWAEDFTQVIIRNFFPAIQDGLVEFSIDDNRIKINAGTLRGLFDDQKIIDAANNSGQGASLTEKMRSLEVLTDPDSHREVIEVTDFGRFQITIQIYDEGPRGVLFVRNGMAISNHLCHHKFSRFSNVKIFRCVVNPADLKSQASKHLRTLETPEHNQFSLDQIEIESSRQIMRRGVDDLSRQIRDIIKRLAGVEVEDVQDLDEVDEYFSNPGEDSGDGTDGPEKPDLDSPSPLGDPPVQPVKKRPQPEGKAGGKGKRKGGKKSKKKAKPPGSGGGTASWGSLPVLRSFVPGSDENKRVVVFESPETGDVVISLRSVEFDGSKLPIKIQACNSGTVKNGEAQVVAIACSKANVELTLHEEFGGPIEVLCNIKPHAVPVKGSV